MSEGQGRTVKLKVSEQIGEPWSPEGKSWTKTVFNFIEPETKTVYKLSTFDTKIKVGDEVEGYIEPANPKFPESLPVFRTKRSGGGGGKYGYSPETERRMMRQTALNAAATIVAAMIGASKSTDKGLMIGEEKFRPSVELLGVFNCCLKLITGETTKKENPQVKELAERLDAVEDDIPF